MSSKKINKRLLLNKKTISNLGVEELSVVKGGIKVLTGTVCNTDTCNYFTVEYCDSFQYPCTDTCDLIPSD